MHKSLCKFNALTRKDYRSESGIWLPIKHQIVLGKITSAVTTIPLFYILRIIKDPDRYHQSKQLPVVCTFFAQSGLKAFSPLISKHLFS